MGYAIKLGAVGALRNYTLKQQGDGIAWSRGPANPFSAKVNTSGAYDKVDIWNEWVQEDWQQGVGRVDPEAGGFLYSDAETRVPNQLILSPLIHQVDTRDLAGTIADCRYMPDNMAGEITVGGTGTNSRVAMKFTTPSSSTPTVWVAYIYANISPDVEVKFEIWSDSSGPSALVGSSFAYTAPEDTPGWYWHGKGMSGSLSNNTSYWLVVYPTTSSKSFTAGYGTSGYNTVAKQYNGSNWADISSSYVLYSTTFYRVSTTGSNVGSGFFRLGGNLYQFNDVRVWKYDETDDQWDLVGAITDGTDAMLSVTGATTWADKVWFGSGGNVNDKTVNMNTSETFDYPSLNGNFFAKYGPYLYRAHENDLYFSADGSTWTGPFAVGSDEFDITGMAGMGDSLYVATAEALYRFAPGNVVEGVTTWGSPDETNGLHMVNYQGALYATVNGRVISFTQDGRLMDIWMSRDDDVIVGRIGKVWHLCVMNNWLVALVSNPGSTGKPTLWAYQDGAWHHLATLPSPATSITPGYYATYACYYDRETQSLWVSSPALVTYRMYTPDYALNPYNDGNATFMPRGWIEQDRFYGGQYLINKDFESVTIAGDNLSSNVCVKVYWQDEGSTAWELLGTIDEDGKELRWSNHSTRPQGKWIRLGLLLQTNDGDETPRIRAIVVKNLPMTNDRIRDNVTLTLKNNIQMPDGKKDTYTLAQQLTHLESMVNSVIPVIYQDPLGVQYETKIIDYSATITKFAYENGANVVKEMDITLVVEQVPDGTYSA